MVYIPAQKVNFGLTESQAKKLANEYDVHNDYFMIETPPGKAQLKSFYIDKYPVTCQQYWVYIQQTNAPRPAALKDGIEPGWENVPVTDITWGQAADYAKWAGKSLCTEDQWQLAASGPDGYEYPWGNNFEQGDIKLCINPSAMVWRPVPVGSNPESISPFGVEDMSGLIMQWTTTIIPDVNPTSARNNQPIGQSSRLKVWMVNLLLPAPKA